MSTFTNSVPVRGVSLSIVTVQFVVGLATIRGNPASTCADTCTLAITGKIKTLQKSMVHLEAGVDTMTV